MSSVPQAPYPVTFDVEYPDRELNRLTTAFRIVVAIPILVIIGLISGGTLEWRSGDTVESTTSVAGGILFVPTALMIAFRQKYPRWWFDWNLQFQRFASRVAVYILLLRDEYPSTDEEQAVHLDFAYPDVERDLNRWKPLYKWLLALPHLVVLAVLAVAVVVVTVVAWFAILFTGRYPRGLFDFVTGVLRWQNRVTGYAFTLVTDIYPPFRLGA